MGASLPGAHLNSCLPLLTRLHNLGERSPPTGGPQAVPEDGQGSRVPWLALPGSALVLSGLSMLTSTVIQEDRMENTVT